jgi:hypothetical protein
MQSEFSQDKQTEHPDQAIHDAFTERPGKPIKIRIQPAIFRLFGGGQYRFWRDVRWTMECDTPNEVFALRDALRAFFRIIAEIGVQATIERLTSGDSGNGSGRKPRAKEHAA